MILLSWVLLLGLGSAQADQANALLSRHNQRLLSGSQAVLQSSSVVLTDAERISVGYGVIVSEEGHVLTKASLLAEGQEYYVRHGREEYTPTVLQVSEEWDLALLSLPVDEAVNPVVFSATSPGPGTVVVSNGVTSLLKRHLKFGVISAFSRPIPMQEATLDLVAGIEKDQGYRVVELRPGGDAEQAGVIVEDLITAINGAAITEFDRSFQAQFHGLWPGAEVSLTIMRDGKTSEVILPLRWLHEVSAGPQDRNEAMSGRISQRRSGFPMVLQHDIPLSARTVGGPLLDLNGECIGINIARYSRAETYAIPAQEIQPLLVEWLEEK